MPIVASALRLKHMGTPSNPSSGEMSLYAKSDGGLYILNDLGVERGLLTPDSAIHLNSDFELGVSAPGDNWSNFWGSAGTWSWDTTSAIQGSRSAKNVSTGGNIRLGNGVYTVVPGSTIKMSAWLKASATSAFTFGFFTSPAGVDPDYFQTGYTEQYADRTVGTAWAKYEASFEVPAGHTRIRFYFMMETNRTWWIDATGSVVTAQAPVLDDTGWLSLSLASGFTDFGGADVHEPPRYRRLNKVVYIEGLIDNASGRGAQSLIATMPAGFRKSGGRSHHTVPANGSFGIINIDTNGDIKWNSGAMTGWISLSGISYPADG